MKNYKVLFSFILTLFTFISSAFAEDIPTLAPKNAYWVFSGIVSDENERQYGYFFQLERQDNEFKVEAAVIDEEKNQLIFQYNAFEKIENPSDFKWKVGNAFLSFNPINATWVFGVKKEDKKGFNFKVDMLSQSVNNFETLRPGLHFSAHQTSKLNGHLRLLDDKEEFITSNNAWFSKMWLSAPQKDKHDLRSGLCRFQDGSGFYMENLQESDAIKASLASWRDISGNAVKMSQFVNLAPLKDKTWKVRIDLPKLEFELENSLMENEKGQIAGFSKQVPKGFCFFNQQVLG